MKTFLISSALIISQFIFCSLSVDAQPNTPKGKEQLVEFNNTTGKFTVPEGKTWYIYNILSDVENLDGERTRIKLKSVNDLVFSGGGPIVYKYGVAMNFPLIFKENTKFEFDINHSATKAIMTYIEVEN